jgi:hypothetical protein
MQLVVVLTDGSISASTWKPPFQRSILANPYFGELEQFELPLPGLFWLPASPGLTFQR